MCLNTSSNIMYVTTAWKIANRNQSIKIHLSHFGAFVKQGSCFVHCFNGLFKLFKSLALLLLYCSHECNAVRWEAFNGLTLWPHCDMERRALWQLCTLGTSKGKRNMATSLVRHKNRNVDRFFFSSSVKLLELCNYNCHFNCY